MGPGSMNLEFAFSVVGSNPTSGVVEVVIEDVSQDVGLEAAII
jgi:hypothetical protein